MALVYCRIQYVCRVFVESLQAWAGVSAQRCASSELASLCDRDTLEIDTRIRVTRRKSLNVRTDCIRMGVVV